VLASIGADAGAAAADLLGDEAPFEHPETGAAERLGNVGVHQAEIPRLAADLARELAVGVVVRRPRDDLLVGELLRQRAQLLLLLGQAEVDTRSSRLTGPPP
jgi:hypothetical protein